VNDADYRVGVLVEHPNMPEWGPGKVIHVHWPKVHVVFRDLPGREAKVIRCDKVPLKVAAHQTDPILDNLPPLKAEGGKWVLPTKERKTFQQTLDQFYGYFPGGFEDKTYLGDLKKGERAYKCRAHDLFVSTLGKGQARALLASDLPELTRRTLHVIGKVNLLDPRFESAPFRDGLNEEEVPARRFFEALLNLLDAVSINEEVFAAYADACTTLPTKEGGKKRVATWPVVTIVPFLAQPNRHMFLKPSVTHPAAETLGFDLRYDATPNWRTYEALLKMSATYLNLLKPKGARDYIDVQSYFWVVGGGY